MPERAPAFLSVVFTGLSACAVISITAAALGRMDLGPEGGSPPIRWRELSEMWSGPPPFSTPETLRYRLSWNGVPCAELRTSLRTEHRKGREWLVMGYEGQTGQVINWAWSFSTAGETWLDPQTLLPFHAYRASREKNEGERSWTAFHRASRSATTVTIESDEESPEVERLSFLHGLDLPATFLLLRVLEMQTPGSRALEFVHGDKAYALELVPGPRQQVEVPAGRFDGQAIEIRLRHLTGEEGQKREESRKYRGMRLWLAGEERIPVRVELEVFVGRVSAELTAME